MDLKLAFKMKIKYLLSSEEHFEGMTEFHKKEYLLDIRAQNEEKFIRIPFSVIGITDKQILVRISGPSGVYVEDHITLKEQSELIEINSDSMYYEIANDQEKYDTLEIFVK